MKRLDKCVIVILPLLFFSCGGQEIIDLSKVSNLDRVLESQAMQYAMPGFAACAVNESEIIYNYTYGYANQKEAIPFTLQTRMVIASISKTMLATAAMQLVEAGLLDLDADINDYLPFSVRNPHWPDTPIKVKMLLTHSSSIRDDGFYLGTYYLFDYVDYPESLESFLRDYLCPDRQHYTRSNYDSSHRPGSFYSYSNVSAALMGYVIECISGMDYAEFCRQNIFLPLGMTRSTFYYADTPIEEVAIPYTDRNNKDPQKPYFSYPTYPDGHLITTVEDLSYFLRAYINDGTWKGFTLLQPESVDFILQKHMETPSGSDCGLIFYEYEYHLEGYSNTWGHNGGDPGISTDMYFDRDRNIGYIMFTNSILEEGGDVIGNALFTYAENYHN